MDQCTGALGLHRTLQLEGTSPAIPRPKWNGFLQCDPLCGSLCEAGYQQTLFLALLLSQSLIAALAF